VTLDPDKATMIDRHSGSRATCAAVLGLCWPSDSPFSSELNISLQANETLQEAADRLDLPWSPSWLIDAGYNAVDAANSVIQDRASSAGAVSWTPEVRMCRVDDQVKDGVSVGGVPYRRRIAGEVALHALWARAANDFKISFGIRPTQMSGNSRGALFRDILVHFLRGKLPKNWEVLHEVPLATIRGLHMRKTVGGRKSDIVVIDGERRLVAVISSKWTWRSDRGTEAAQMVPLSRYRPDVPYALATAEFPRVSTVARESVEDRAYHICPEWVGAWYAVNRARDPRRNWPRLTDLNKEGQAMADALDLASLDQLAEDLKNSGTIL
jgi:hypothetical protein